ncbi:unnamed protein product [Allacma fusca]|uniref:Uncharacterized protein n=1 Tax=Allacma fusca TaxID=39272 RepID=A0A8J2NRY2_9HEXA|nr:unnamed protein product [Allacma fusca]
MRVVNMAHFWVSFVTLLLSINYKNACLAAQSEAEAQIVLEVPAMGRMAQLGEFYDATDDTFLNQLIFSRRVPEGANLITTVDNPSTETKFQVVEGMIQKLTFLGIAASIAVTLKTGGFNIDVKGAASYVKDEKHSEKFVEGFLVHKTETSRDSVDLFYEGIRPYVDVNVLMETTSTHVVTGIYNGADVAARFTDKNQLDQDRQDIKGHLEIAFSMQNIQVSGSATVNITDGEFTNSSSYELKVSGDVPMDTIPRNAYEVIEFIKTIPTLLEDINSGKGKPIRYVLTPLHELQKVYKMDYMKAKVVEAIDEAILNEILETFEAIGKTRQKLNDIQDLFDKYVHSCMTPSIKKSLDELSNFFDATAGQFTADIRNGLVAVRNNTREMGDLQVIINEYNTHENASAKVNIRLEHEFEDGKRKIQFFEAFMKHMEPEQYMTESTYEADLIKTDDHVFYVLFYNLTLVDQDIEAWEDGTYLFFNQLKRIWSKLKVVDCDFALQNATCKSLTKTKIYSFISNRKVSSDVLLDYGKYQRYDTLRIPAIQIINHDKIYELGNMFNVSTGSFIEASLLNRKNTLKTETTYPAKKIKCEIFHHTNQSMLEALSIPPEKHIPLLLQNEILNGTGLILNVEQEHTKERLNLICVCTSKKEWINIASISKTFFDSIDLLSLVDRKEASHFIQATEYILNGVVSLEIPKSDGAADLLRRKLDVIKSAIEVTHEGGDIFTNPGFVGITIRMFTDLQNREILEVTSLADILNKFFELQKSIENHESRSPVYTLYPIPTMQTQYGLITEPRYVNNRAIFLNFLQFAGHFDNFVPLVYNISNATSSFSPYLECIPKVTMDQIQNYEKTSRDYLNSSKVTLDRAFRQFKEKDDPSLLNQPLEELSNVTTEGERALTKLIEIKQVYKEKKTFYDIWLKNKETFSGAYITGKDQIVKAIEASDNKLVYLLFFQLAWMKDFQEIWIENMSTFFSLFVKTNHTGFAVDCEFFECGVGQPVIQEYDHRKLSCPDVVLRIKNQEKGNETAEGRLEQDLKDHIGTQEISFISLHKQVQATKASMETYKTSTYAKINKMIEELKNSEGSPPPVNAIYTIYPYQNYPNQVWNGTCWKDISSTIPGVYGQAMQRINC